VKSRGGTQMIHFSLPSALHTIKRRIDISNLVTPYNNHPSSHRYRDKLNFGRKGKKVKENLGRVKNNREENGPWRK
jgi:hypothetical protein